MQISGDSSKSPFITIQPDSGKQGVSTLPIRIQAEDSSSNSRIISVQPEAGKQGVSTLPIRITDDSSKDPRCSLSKEAGVYSPVGYCSLFRKLK